MLMPPTTNPDIDSEDDFDYVPPDDDHDSDSSGEEDQAENMTETAPPPTDPAEQKRQRDALWASFQASVSTPHSDGPSQTPQPSAVKRVQIEKTYLFAGKHVKDVVEVPEDSEDAKKWPRWSPRFEAAPVSTEKGEEKKKADEPASLSRSLSPAPAPVADPSPTASTATPTPGSKRPGPRKPRTALPSIPKASQAKKITTLDKSAMDWRAHVASQSGNVKDELDANRRGGGYLEKVEFLNRVQDRRDDAFEASKSSKRRKT